MQEIQLPLKETDFWNAFLSICRSLLPSEPVYGKAKIWVTSQPANIHITNTQTSLSYLSPHLNTQSCLKKKGA